VVAVVTKTAIDAASTTPPEFLDLDWLRDCFDGSSLRECRRQYQRFIDTEELRLTDLGNRASARAPFQHDQQDHQINQATALFCCSPEVISTCR
jgi:hypothetical protein